MARPHCGKCDSTMVYRDRDPYTGAISICCQTCGNRWPGGGPGFYMAEREEIMSMKRECKNCRRVMAITQEGMCGYCYLKVKGLPPGEKRETALAAAREGTKNLPPGRERPRTPVAPIGGGLAAYGGKVSRRSPAKRRGDSLEREIDEIVKTHPGVVPAGADDAPPGPPAEKKKQFRKALAGLRFKKKSAAVYPISPEIHQATLSPTPEHMVIIQVRFDEADRGLLEDFQALCRKRRRLPGDQILAMIEEACMGEKALQEEFGKRA